MEGQTISLSYSSRTRKSCDSISILVVDDDTTCLSIVSALLKKFKYEVVTVKHPNDALCALRIKGGAFDLVISDVHMPDMNGFELQEVITHEFNLPVVLMSGDNKEGVASKGLESGAAFFITKPVSSDDLRNLWQFAAMKKKSNVVIEEESAVGKEMASENDSDGTNVSLNKKDSKRKSPSKEGSDSSGQSDSKKKQKVIWTNALHNRFLEAIRSIGLDRSVPKKILEVMNVPGLTRENVASHLQKYRIFLRRVSDASYKINYADDKGLSRSFTSSRTSLTHSTRLTQPSFHNFPTIFPNQEATSTQSPLGQYQSFSISANLLRPNIRHLNLIHHNDHLSYQTSPSLQDLLSSTPLPDHTPTLDASILGLTMRQTPSTIPQASSSDFVSSLASTNFADQMNYAGYRISNLKHLAELGSSKECEGLEPCNATITLHHNGLQSNAAAGFSSDNALNLDRLLGGSSCYVPEVGQLPDVISDYQSLMPPSSLSLLGNMENEGPIQDSIFSPLNDLSEFDIMGSQQPLGEADLDPYFPEQVNIQNQAQQQNGGETTVNIGFYGSTNNWDNNFTTYDQAPNQREDDDYLESLLAFGSFGEDDQIQTLEGI